MFVVFFFLLFIKGVGRHLLVIKEGVDKSWNVSEVASIWEEAKCSCKGRYVADDIGKVWW